MLHGPAAIVANKPLQRCAEQNSKDLLPGIVHEQPMVDLRFPWAWGSIGGGGRKGTASLELTSSRRACHSCQPLSVATSLHEHSTRCLLDSFCARSELLTVNAGNGNYGMHLVAILGPKSC